ncbi:MAG: family 10 glycosylhydrolase [Planctomycetes bacterium]|nr:family 10 glycosylhydrolase [Planctomycetota bacterium]MCC7169884.1 family 10 glycosylhydrolase [Planctomycetota bacterium]
MNARLFARLASLAFASLTGCSTSSMFDEPVRAIWVTRFDTKTAADVQGAIRDCSDAGFNHVLFQARGHGVAHYRSAIEPWADELGGADPGYDPLDVACREAHELGLKLHAWINVMPSWRGTTPPKDERQLYAAHPDWHWFDASGARQPQRPSFYVSLNPCLPEVRAYLVEVCRELVVNYPIDGLHLDYVRFVDDLDPDPDAYPRDAATLALFRAATGKAPDDDLAAWRAWKAEQVTTLVGDIRAMIDDEGRDVVLTAAVGSSPEGPQDKHQRDSRRWVEEGLVDAVFPMNYTADITQFRTRASAWGRATRDMNVAFVQGIQIDPQRALDVVETQLALSRRETPHYCLFAYAHLFPSAANASGATDLQRERTRRIVRLVRGGMPQPSP